jgi:membrane protease YdiL (CAAX protease family)
MSFFKRESLEFAGFVRRNANELAVIAFAALFLVIARYHKLDPRWMTYLVYYLALPVGVIVAVLRKNPLDFGLRAGNYRLWIPHVAVAWGVTIVILLVAARFSDVSRFYAESDLDFWGYAARWAVLLFSLEFLYRGFLMFGLRERYGEGAILIQMLPFVLLHIGKPEVETIGCILSGTWFGYVAYRSKSVWPAFLIHFFANVANKIIIGSGI